MRARAILVAALLLPAATARAEVHRVDCDDPRWRSLAAVASLELKPGDELRLRAGCRWEGTLRTQGSGEDGRPIVIGRYGEGPAPRIDGAGAEAAVLLHNQEYIEVRDLEITNDAATPGLRRGVLVRAVDLGRALRHVRVIGLDIHHVKGQLGADMTSKATGGIGFEVVTSGRPTRLHDILVEGNRIRTVDNVGIYIDTDVGPHPRDPRWESLHHTRLVVRGNTLEDIGKNAIIVRASLRPLIESNVVRNAAARLHGNAIFVFGCKDAVMQFNAVSGTTFHGLEGAAYDSDYNSEGTVIQYNESRENGGGLVNLCANPASTPPRGYNDGTIVRYNISRGDVSRVIAFDGPVTNTEIHNNTIVVAPGRSPRIVEFDVFGKSPGYASDARFRNNLIVNEGEGTYVMGGATGVRFEANCFSGRHPESEPPDPMKVTADARLDAASIVTGRGAAASGLALGPGSPCAGSGVPIQGHHGLDFAGTPLPAGRPDRGAVQRQPVQVEAGVVFARPQPGVELKADVYRPTGPGPHPAVVYLHGGGWNTRQRGQLRRQATHMATLGVLGVAVEYRLAREAVFPAPVFDAKAAVRWLRANAAAHAVDPDRIAVVGSSAGGTMAALLGLTRSDPRLEGDGCCLDQRSEVRAVVALNPPLDFSAMAHHEGTGTRLLGAPCAQRPEACRLASPMAHVGPGAAPMLLLGGTADETVPFEQITAMAAALRAAGARVEVFTAPGGEHTFWATPRWYYQTLKAIEAFLIEHLAVRPPSPD